MTNFKQSRNMTADSPALSDKMNDSNSSPFTPQKTTVNAQGGRNNTLVHVSGFHFYFALVLH